MRSIWKGSLTFGLVNVPVRLYSATQEHDITFHQVHEADGGRIQYHRVCTLCQQRVDYADISKAYTSGDGRTVLIDPGELDRLPSAAAHEIEVLEFVPSDEVDPILYERSYFLEPDERAVKAYVLLRETLKTTNRTAIVRFALRQKTHLAALRVSGDVLMVQTLLWRDEVRQPEFRVLGTEVDLRKQELAMASSLVESLSAQFHPEDYRDEYRDELVNLIDAKLEGGSTIVSPTSTDEGDAKVLDLVSALRASVDQARSSGRKPQPDQDSAEKSSGAQPSDDPAAKDPEPADEGKPTPKRSARNKTAS